MMSIQPQIAPAPSIGDATNKRRNDTLKNDSIHKKQKIRDQTVNKSNNENEKTNKKDQDDESDEKAFQMNMYKSMIQSAFEKIDKYNSKKDPSSIDNLSSQINDNSISVKDLTIILRILANEISRLDNKYCFPLIDSILKINWWNNRENTEFIKVYSRFLAVLVSGIPKFCHDIIDKLISDFSKYNKLPSHHEILGFIIKIIPTSLNYLDSALGAKFPNKNDSALKITNYIKNLLFLTSYCEDLKRQIWSLMIESTIKLDVELQNELDELDDKEINKALYSSDDEDDSDEDDLLDSDGSDSSDSDNDSDSDSDLDSEDDDDNVKIVGENLNEDEDDDGDEDDDNVEYNIEVESVSKLSQKLDSIMRILLSKSSKIIKNEAQLLSALEDVEHRQLEQRKTLFNILLSIFQSHILPTHNTKTIQFILFHACQQESYLVDLYVLRLIDIVFNKHETQSNRIKAMQYMSSFLARSKSVSKTQLVDVISFLTTWCLNFINERESEINDGNGGMERFYLLYSVLQGLLYIFCFRHEDLKRDPEEIDPRKNESEWECAIDKFFQRLIMSSFNPLKYCNESVVLVFAGISQQHNLCYCFSIIERNKRERLNGVTKSSSSSSTATTSSSTAPSSSSSSSSVKSGNSKMDSNSSFNFGSRQEFLDLEAYFPFDPIVLKKSKKVIDENYIEWDNDDYDDSE